MNSAVEGSSCGSPDVGSSPLRRSAATCLIRRRPRRARHACASLACATRTPVHQCSCCTSVSTPEAGGSGCRCFPSICSAGRRFFWPPRLLATPLPARAPRPIKPLPRVTGKGHPLATLPCAVQRLARGSTSLTRINLDGGEPMMAVTVSGAFLASYSPPPAARRRARHAPIQPSLQARRTGAPARASRTSGSAYSCPRR